VKESGKKRKAAGRSELVMVEKKNGEGRSGPVVRKMGWDGMGERA